MVVIIFILFINKSRVYMPCKYSDNKQVLFDASTAPYATRGFARFLDIHGYIVVTNTIT